MMAKKPVPVSQVTHLHTTRVSPTEVTLAWTAPVRGTPPIMYTVFYRKMGAEEWTVGPVVKSDSVQVERLHPSTEYEFEILAHNE